MIDERIRLLIPRLGSEHEAEVIATVRAIQRVLAADKQDFHDLAKAIDVKPPVHVFEVSWGNAVDLNEAFQQGHRATDDLSRIAQDSCLRILDIAVSDDGRDVLSFFDYEFMRTMHTRGRAGYQFKPQEIRRIAKIAEQLNHLYPKETTRG